MHLVLLLVCIHTSVSVCGGWASEIYILRNGALFYTIILVPEYSRDSFATKILRQKYL